jgi:Ca2+-transporting ATPase
MRSSKTGHKRVVKHDWHALSVGAVYEALAVNEHGLGEDEVTKRRSEYGGNEFTEEERESVFARVLRQLRSPLTIVLVIAFFITIALAEYIDATVIMLALLIAVFVGVFQEGKAGRAFEKLAKSQVHVAIVVREGKRHEIHASGLVPGDVVLMQGGMYVPADVRITSAKNLSVSEAQLTGESMPVKKDPKEVDVGTPLAETASMAWLGTFIASGYGTGIVVATGDRTVMGELARDLDEIVDVRTPIQWEMAKISRIMLMIVLVLVALIFFIGVIRGEPLEIMLLTAIAIAVAAIPEGLPAAVTIILAVGMEALLSRGGLVRNLLAAETLGSTTYILTDKTGTLTKGRMAVTNMVYVDCMQSGDGVCNWSEDERAKGVLDIALCASDAFLDEHKNGEESYVVRGEPMERAILEAGQDAGITLHGESSRGKRIDYLAFESENGFAVGLAQHGEERILCFNGMPELLLRKSTKVVTDAGVIEMSLKNRGFFEDEIQRETKNGKRLIAVAFKHVDFDDIPLDTKGLVEGLVFLGLLVITDPVRTDVKEAISGVMAAGAKVRLVTGDNPETALTIAREVGIARKLDVALTGDDIRGMSDSELLGVIRTTHVFARVLPRQKMRIAQILQASGEIVAMTGDGINDASALQKANIGIAIGSGTEVAKEASDLILVNDTFSTIYSAIEEGRRIISNLRKIVGYLLSTSLSEAVLIGGALLSSGPIPILPVQILWANIIEEGLMSVAFAFEKGDKHAMKEKPEDIHEKGILSREMLYFVGCAIAVLSVVLLTLYAYLRITEVPLGELRSIMFLAVALDSLFMAFSFRSLTTPIWKIPLRNNIFFAVSFALNFVLLGIVISVPLFQTLLSYEPLTLNQLMLPFFYGLTALLIIETGKWAFFERKK